MTHNITGDFIHFDGQGVHLGLYHCAGFIHKVDSLIGEETIRDIAVAERCRGDKGIIVDLDAVVDLVTLFKPSENGYCILNIGLLHHNGLESALERGILFNVFAVFVKGRCTDAVQLTPCKHGLQDIACIHCALSFACADDCMDFIYEQDNFALALFDLVQHCLQPLLEFAAVLGAGNERTHIERKYLPVFKVIGHIAPCDTQRKALGDGGFADAGFTYQTGVILRLS